MLIVEKVLKGMQVDDTNVRFKKISDWFLNNMLMYAVEVTRFNEYEKLDSEFSKI